MAQLEIWREESRKISKMTTKKGLEHEAGECTSISLIVGMRRKVERRSCGVGEGRVENTKHGYDHRGSKGNFGVTYGRGGSRG